MARTTLAEAPLRVTSVLSALALACPVGALSQQLPLTPGQRVRTTAPDIVLPSEEATFQRVRGDTMFVVHADAAYSSAAIPLSSVTRLEVYDPEPLRLTSGTAIWAGVGAAAGAFLLTGVFCRSCDASLAAVGMAGGALLGGTLGTGGGRPWKWAGYGALAGGLAGGVLGALDSCTSDCVESPALAGAAIGVAGGAVLGALGGRLFDRGRWRDVPIERLRVSVLPRREGVGVVAHIGF